MGNKISANLYRLGVTKNWNSRWFGTVRNLPKDLQEDAKIRKFVTKTLLPILTTYPLQAGLQV